MLRLQVNKLGEMEVVKLCCFLILLDEKWLMSKYGGLVHHPLTSSEMENIKPFNMGFCSMAKTFHNRRRVQLQRDTTCGIDGK